MKARYHSLVGLIILLVVCWQSTSAQTSRQALQDPMFNGLYYFNPHPDWPKEDFPYYWPNPSVPAPNWPEAHPDAKPDPGMTRYQYYNKLCKLEAGEFIYRTVSNVDGFYVIRPRLIGATIWDGIFTDTASTDRIFTHRAAIEDPYGAQDTLSLNYGAMFHDASKPDDRRYSFIEQPYIDLSAVQQPHYYFRDGRRPVVPWIREYKYFADPPDADGKPKERKRRDILIRRGGEGQYLRYERSDKPIVDQVNIDLIAKKWDDKPNQKWRPKVSDYTYYPAIETRVPTIKSRYGVLWRGISRPQDRAMGIGGGEVIVLDLQTNEILAVRRGFAMSTVGDGHKVWWKTTATCPNYTRLKSMSAQSFIYGTLQFPIYPELMKQRK